MKKVFSILTVLFGFFFLVSCGSSKTEEPAAENTEGKLKVAMVYSVGGKGDKSFNDSAYAGLQRVMQEFGVEVAEYEPKDASVEIRNQLAEYAQDGTYDLIMTIGFTSVDPLTSVAKEYPNQKFVLIDDAIEGLPNVLSVSYKEQEGTFLTGALAALMSKTNKVGFIGGTDAPVIARFATGFKQGAKYINPNIDVLISYINGSNPWNDPVAAKQLAESLNSKGADVIMHAAGGSGSGLFKAAEEKGFYAIGVDSDQDDIVQGKVLTSMLKRVDNGVYDIIKDLKDGKFEAGVKYIGLAEDGLDTTEFKYTKDIIGKENLDKIAQIKQDIKDGKIKVSDKLEK